MRRLAVLWIFVCMLAGCTKPAQPAMVSVTVNRLTDQGDADMQTYTFVDATYGWYAAGRSIYVTADGGRTWAKQYQDQVQVLSLDFISANEGWAGTENGVLRTQDGGRTWARFQGGKVTRIDFVDGAHGWAYANDELVTTGDGGRTWSALASPCPETDRPFSFVSPSTGFLMCGGPGPGAGQQKKLFYRTADGGQSWTQVRDLSGGGYVSDLFFLDEQRGYLSENRGTLLATTDGGLHWAPIGPDLFHESEGEVRFVSPNDGFLSLVLGNVWLYATHDGGKNWGRLYPELHPQIALPDQAFDMQHWVAAITRLSGGAILRTEDAGAHWRQVADLGAPVQALSFPDPQRGWAATTGGLYRTTDGGSTWAQLSPKVYRLVDFLDAQTGFASDGQKLLFTDDGGRSFTEVSTGEGYLLDLAFATKETGWAIRDFRLYATADGGRTWRPASVPAARVTSVQALPGGAVVVRGDEQFLYASRGGGKTWTTYDFGDFKVGPVRFVDANHGLMANYDGATDLYTTADGGRSWTQIR